VVTLSLSLSFRPMGIIHCMWMRCLLLLYSLRSAEHVDHLEVSVIKPNDHYPWQYCALQTAMRF
jgi:hypothetical protein